MTDLSLATGPAELASLLPPAISAKYPYARGYLLLRAPENAEVVACRALLEPERLAALLDRFALKFPGSDRRATASLWTMHYFGVLTIGAAIAVLEAGQALPLKLDDVSLCLEQGSAQPRAFVLPAPAGESVPAEAALGDLLRSHAEPLIEALAIAGRISRRLLWSNVLSYLGWIVDEIAGSGVKGEASNWANLIRAAAWPDGWANPMHGLIQAEVDGAGVPCARRRVCCLRYALPSIGGCGTVCPLPAGRH